MRASSRSTTVITYLGPKYRINAHRRISPVPYHGRFGDFEITVCDPREVPRVLVIPV